MESAVNESAPTKGVPVEGGDIALQFAANAEAVSPELISKVRRKIDLYVLPLLA